MSRPIMRALLVGALVAGVVAPVHAAPAAAATLPSGFQEQIVFSGLNAPTDLEFAPDGRIFVAEKGGRIKVFDNLADTSPTVFADLSTNVHDQWDRGLLGLALPPNFPTSPWVYVLYTYDAPPGQVAPRWNDVCPDPSNGLCVVTGRLSKLQASGDVMTGTEQVLIHDWCQQYPSHSIGDLEFGADGMLYATGGDGASFSAVDYGNLPSGNPTNPCSDPPNEGGALRSQDLRTTADETQLDGSLLRLDPTTGAAAPGNPNIGSPDPDTRRIVATGLRNPFRLTLRPGTNEAWISDTGWNTWEEVDRVVDPTAGVANFGWPCYEGNLRQDGYDGANLSVCETLYSAGPSAHTLPFVAWNHPNKLIPGEACPTGSSSSTGVAFYPTTGGPYPAAYNGALFFADYSRDCIWASLPTTPGGLPSASNLVTFASSAASPVDLELGPGNELYYVDLNGTIRRIRYFPGNQPPTAVIDASPTQGPVPMTVNFSATSSTDPDPADQGRLTYAWDFTNDGTTDSTAPTTSFTYTTAGNFTARLTITDSLGATDSETVIISPGNQAPTAVIDTPTAGTTWRVGNTIGFTGHATDPQQGTLPASALSWQLRLQHCSDTGSCHTHVLQNWTGVASGSFVTPDHEYPSYLELELVATDQDNLSHRVVRRLDPQTVSLTFATNPSGLQLVVGSTTGTTPFTRTVIQGSTNSVSALSPQSVGGRTYNYTSWSDGGAQSHVITAPTAATTYTASYAQDSACVDSFGYTCTVSSGAFTPADQTVLSLTGDDQYQQITLPFPVPFYGGSYSTAWVDTNGVITFTTPNGSAWNHGAIPSPPAANKPNLAAYPLWDDLVVDSSASVRTAVTGTAPNRRFIVEWRNVRFWANSSARVTFESIFEEGTGIISFAYSGIDASPLEQGGEATVGIENADGSVALAYSYNQPRLRSGDVVQFVPPDAPPPPPPPAPAVVAGTVTSSSGGTPIAGATVTVSGTSLSTTTATNGTYSFPDVPPGSHTVNAQKIGFLPGSTTVTAVSGTTVTANIALTPAPPCSDSFGYTCTAGPTAWTPADQTVLTLTGDDAYQQISLPFGVTLYGTTYTTAWVDTNGVLSFIQPSSSAWDHGAIPSGPAANRANGAVYPFWGDLLVDASASVRTSLTGTAPNRKFIVEWRNVRFYADSTSRVSFEVVLSENSDVTVAWQDIGTTALEQGGSATVGIENAQGTTALQYSLNQPVLRNGMGVLFHPPTP
ncbi:Glucose/arabinose dehydrogenase, beta-propeller fold [Micromonospora rhizosphaerae]|uniref:alpha-amylase n=1 Tax=Micromonospora rhizosphaerae TaxID=568872 RepID=A0A1C6SWX1_9ACTN|nr:PQQ-dependent sugar dehydrogenase [Micromonospora rhizosphaerae]SCL34094.1 Glucose/arabinose dehydrogenase, beta-propeller fold [Micromonospora rhizosphaerae]